MKQDVEFTLVYRIGTESFKNRYSSFSAAAGAAEGLKDRAKTIWLGANIDRSHYGALYKYKNGARGCVNKGFLEVVLKALENN